MIIFIRKCKVFLQIQMLLSTHISLSENQSTYTTYLCRAYKCLNNSHFPDFNFLFHQNNREKLSRHKQKLQQPKLN